MIYFILIIIDMTTIQYTEYSVNNKYFVITPRQNLMHQQNQINLKWQFVINYICYIQLTNIFNIISSTNIL